jgi:hypothetical protein
MEHVSRKKEDNPAIYCNTHEPVTIYQVKWARYIMRNITLANLSVSNKNRPLILENFGWSIK